MNQEKFQRAQSIFVKARQLSAKQRDPYLQRECDGDAELLQEVKSLLGADTGALPVTEAAELTRDLGLGPLAASLTEEMSAQALPPPSPPQQIGDYRIISILGHGGMGVVYRAEQANPRREVALKVIARSFISDQLLRRFDLEAQTLGRLKHVGIAQIYEAGVNPTELGPQPFFAMELIDGVPVDDYVQQHQLSVRDRLELLIKICDAVQYAHQQGIIHRDLKPGNILVTSDGQPKILDFGIARATDSDVKTTTMQTDVGQLIGTLPYMSPEQAGGNPEEIDTRSDVYALGVIAYELLGGKLPHSVHDVATLEALRRIKEDEPSRLSSIDKSYRGDVETIVQKALEKDKTRRYQTANALAADVKRYLNYEPIAARPPSTWYRLGKFASRNKLLVGSTIFLILVLVAGAAVSTAFALVARRQRQEALVERDNAKATLDFLTTDLLAGATPENIPDVKVRDEIIRFMIDPAAKQVGNAFKERPLIEASVRDAIQTTLDAIGRPDLALPHAETALKLRRQHLGQDHPDAILSLMNYAYLLHSLGRIDEAEPLMKEALDRSQEVLGENHSTLR